MALRSIRMLGDEMLTKPCREVKEITPRIEELVDDMLETMYEAEGIGLAAPQVGVLRQVVVIDIWQDDIDDSEDEEEETEFENPAETADAAESEETVRAEDAAESEEEAKAQDAAESAEQEESEEPEESETPEEEDDYPGPLVMINPVILRTEGEQTADEGCLSLPGKVGKVTRPMFVEVSFFDENMDEYDLEAEGLLARAICHEVDHLSGHMYVELVEGEIHDVRGPDDEEDDESDEESEAGEPSEGKESKEQRKE